MILERGPFLNVNEKNNDADLARRYLCGLLADEHGGAVRDEVEERLLSDAGFALLVEAVERDLFDELAAGSLHGDERRGFVRYVESHPEARARMRFASALLRQRNSVARPWQVWRGYLRDWHVAAAVAMLVLSVGVVLRVFWGGLDAPPRPKPEPAVFAFALVPGTLRSGEGSAAPPPQLARIPANAVAVTIDLAGARVNPPHTARIYFVDTGQEVWKGAVREGRVRVPSSQLRAGDHVLTTIGAAGEELADYVFRVVR